MKLRKIVAMALFSFFVVSTGGAKSDEVLERIRPYRTWTKLTSQPLQIAFGSVAG